MKLKLNLISVFVYNNFSFTCCSDKGHRRWRRTEDTRRPARGRRFYWSRWRAARRNGSFRNRQRRWKIRRPRRISTGCFRPSLSSRRPDNIFRPSAVRDSRRSGSKSRSAKWRNNGLKLCGREFRLAAKNKETARFLSIQGVSSERCVLPRADRYLDIPCT